MQKEEGVWSEVSTRGVLEKQILKQKFKDKSDGIWQELKEKKWIEEIDSTKASVTAKDQRSPTPLEDLKDEIPDIEEILDRAHIGPVDLTARFSGRQEIREGWLKLSAERRNGN
jgi:hypothetical protein